MLTRLNLRRWAISNAWDANLRLFSKASHRQLCLPDHQNAARCQAYDSRCASYYCQGRSRFEQKLLRLISSNGAHDRNERGGPEQA